MASSDSSDYKEEELEATDILCVFCEDVLSDEHQLKKHCVTGHSIDIFKVFGQLGDTFHVIKAINYLRKIRPSPDEFNQLAKRSSRPWDPEEFLQPVVPNDPLLLIDFDDAFIKHSTHIANTDMNDVDILRQSLQFACERIAHMRKTARAILGDDDDGPSKTKGDHNSMVISSLKVSDDRDYIDSYSHCAIHQDMLQDIDRNEAYRLGIVANKKQIEGKTCLDVGCGTGILSMFLAREGKAAKVQAVDFSEIIYTAMDIIQENNYQNVVTFKKGKFEDLVSRKDDIDGLVKVGVIVSEWMGYFLLYESMLDTVITARDTLLESNGIILPCKASMFLTISDKIELYERNVTYWDNVYGFKMTSMKRLSLTESLVEICHDKDICGTEAEFKKFDMYTVTVEETVSFSSTFDIIATRDAKVVAFVGYFNVYFDSEEKVLRSPYKELHME